MEKMLPCAWELVIIELYLTAGVGIYYKQIKLIFIINQLDRREYWLLHVFILLLIWNLRF